MPRFGAFVPAAQIKAFAVECAGAAAVHWPDVFKARSSCCEKEKPEAAIAVSGFLAKAYNIDTVSYGFKRFHLK